MGKTALSLLDEQPSGPLGGDPRGTPRGVHGCAGESECGRGCEGICEVCWRNFEKGCGGMRENFIFAIL